MIRQPNALALGYTTADSHRGPEQGALGFADAVRAGLDDGLLAYDINKLYYVLENSTSDTGNNQWSGHGLARSAESIVLTRKS